MWEYNIRQRLALLLAHVAGMIDLVALPLWVGAALIGHYKFSPQEAGSLATAYLVSVVITSLLVAPRLAKYAPHVVAPVSYAAAALACVLLAQVNDFATMMALHIAIGLAVGVGLSTTHGVIGRSKDPHRLFAFAGTGLGIFAVIFMSSMAVLLPAAGGPVLFYGFAAMMIVAALAAAVAFPRVVGPVAVDVQPAPPRRPVSPAVWWAVAGISLMVVTQATMGSFFERIGVDHGFGESVILVLAAAGFVTILPPILASLLQAKWPAQRVALIGPLVQAGLAVVIVGTMGLVPYAIAVPLFMSSIIFTHTFAFGWLARLDPSGRVTALTPAMLMTGSAIGPALGGVLVQQIGYWALGVACVVISLLSAACSFRAARIEQLNPEVVPAPMSLRAANH